MQLKNWVFKLNYLNYYLYWRHQKIPHMCLVQLYHSYLISNLLVVMSLNFLHWALSNRHLHKQKILANKLYRYLMLYYLYFWFHILNNFECKLNIEHYHMTVHFRPNNLYIEVIEVHNTEGKSDIHSFRIKGK
jgi:hypothetical protein